jgi:hypothetical protein
LTIAQLRKAIRAVPFRPFVICPADGHRLPVVHTECVAIAREASRTFVVAGRGEDFKIVDLLRVTCFDFTNAPPAGSNGRRKRKGPQPGGQH